MKNSKKIIIGVALSVIGVLFFIWSIGNFNGLGAWVGILLLIAGVLLIYCSRSHKSPHVGNIQTDNSSFIKYDFKLAGVTFKNDEGKSRQLLLRKLKFNDPPFDNKAKFSLEKFKYNGEDAIRVLANGKDIGNVPRSDLNYILKNFDNISHIQVFVIGGGHSDNGDEINFGGKVLLYIEPNSNNVNNVSPQNSRVVYYALNSNKYHYDKKCGGMKNYRITTEEQAKRNGMTLCKKCEDSFNKFLYS